MQTPTAHSRIASRIAPALTALFILSSAVSAQALEPREMKQLDETPEIYQGSPVRNRILYRSTRLELAPLFAATLADSFKRNLLPGVSVNFFLTDTFSIGGTIAYGLFHPDTSLKTNLEDALIGAGNRQADLDRLSFSSINWIAEVEGSYVPIVGKFSLLNQAQIKYDVHLLFGVSFVGLGAEKSERAIDQTLDEALTGSQVAPTIGVGTRMFLSDNVSLNLQLRNLIFQRAELSDGNVDTEWANHPMISIGLSYFLGEVKVSR